MSLTARILFGFALLSVVGLLAVFGPVLRNVERQYLEAAEEPMVDTAELLAAMVGRLWETEEDPIPLLAASMEHTGERNPEARIYHHKKTSVTTGLYLTDDRGILIYHSRYPEKAGENFSRFLDVKLALEGRYGARTTPSRAQNHEEIWMFVAAPVLVHGEIAGVVSVFKPRSSLMHFIESTRRGLMFIAVLGAGFFLLSGFLFSRWISQPLVQLTQYAEAAGRGEKVEPPKLPGRQLGILSHAIGRMREALEDRRYVENYVRALSHEMKSPVSGIRGAAELLIEEQMPPERQKSFLQNILRESERLARSVEQLLALSALERRKNLQSPSPVDLSGLLQAMAADWEGRSREAGLEWRCDIPPGMVITGEAFLIEKALANLLQNALDFTPPGGSITLAAAYQKDHIRLTVTDTGLGIPDYAADKIFHRFYSLPRANGTKSSGLGLCLVEEAVGLHGGRVLIERRSDGPGTVASIDLPSNDRNYR